MKKYYIRFNPLYIGRVRRVDEKPWQVIELVKDQPPKRYYLDHVDISVPSNTEQSVEDRDWWNISCHGYLIVNETHGTIVDQLP